MVTVPPGQGEQPGTPGPYGQSSGSQPYGHHGQQPPPSQFPGQPFPGQAFPGQPPGTPQLFGQPPQPQGQPQSLYGQSMPPVPSTPPEKKKVGKRIAVIVAVVGAFVFAGLLAVGYLNAAHNAEPGDCLHIEDFSDQKEAPKVHECSDEEATLKVAVKLEDNSESCPDGDYDQMVYEDGARFCLMLNVEEGECLANVRSPSKGYEKVACTDPKADVSVVKIVEGTDDIEQACAPVAGAMAAVRYSEPATVICVGEPTAV